MRCWIQTVLLTLGGMGMSDCLAQPPGMSGRNVVSAIQAQVLESVAKAESAVVSIARVPRDQAAAGFHVPNLGNLGLLLPGDATPTDMDFVPSDFGAGVVIDRAGLIVTAYHVIGNVKESDYYVWSRQRPYRAQVLAADPWLDLAVLRVDGGRADESRGDAAEVEPPGFEPIQLGDAKSLVRGQFVIALGNPQAIARDGRASASWGIVSNLARRAPRVPERSNESSGRETVHHYGTLIQTDARWDPGYGGGALVNLSGEMVGLLTAYAGAPQAARTAGFAIPVDEHFRAALDRMKSGQSPEFGFLGIRPRPLDTQLRRLGRHGAFVETVSPASPAARAEIRPGDVITHADGEPLFDDDDLFRVIGSRPPERVVQLTVFRGDLWRLVGETRQLSARLDKKQLNTRRPPYQTARPTTWRGMQVDYASVAMDDNPPLNQLLPREGCVHVHAVDDDSPAWRAGVRPGMFVYQVGTRRVTTPAEFFTAVRGPAVGAATDERDLAGDVALHVLRGNGTLAIQTVSP